jgi:hypothetical protein
MGGLAEWQIAMAIRALTTRHSGLPRQVIAADATVDRMRGNVEERAVETIVRRPVDPEHKGRGYEVAKGQYLIVEDEKLEAIEIESTHVIEIDSFVPRRQIDERSHSLLCLARSAASRRQQEMPKRRVTLGTDRFDRRSFVRSRTMELSRSSG